jgi:hypothetical protein
MNKINKWFDEGQKPAKVNLGIPPQTSPWEAFIIWGKSSDFMQPTNRQREEESKLFVKQIGL